MRQFFRGGRELPFGQSDVCSVNQNRLLRREAPRKDETGCNDEMWRSDDRVGLNVSSLITIFCVLFSCLLVSPAFGQEAKGLTQNILRGVVSSVQDGKPIEGASVSVDKRHTRTDKQGRFTISVDKPTGVLTIKHIGYKEQRVAYEITSTTLNIALQANEKQIEEVEVVSTGYQKIPKERATGSFEFIDNKQLSKRVGPTIIDRLENMSNSLRMDKSYEFSDLNEYHSIPQFDFDIRGRTMISGSASRTVVLDNVIYEGDLRNINPNDIESVTVLKDAVATSIWGVAGGGGVIVLTSKKGAYNSPFKLSFNSNLTIKDRPDLYSRPFMNSTDFIEYERFLYDKGYFKSKLSNKTTYPSVSPVVELLDAVDKKLLTSVEAEAQIEVYKGYDVRDDYYRYIYRNSVFQQYALGLSGGNNSVRFNLTGGYDHNKNQLITSKNDRLTFSSSLQARPLEKMEVSANVTYAQVTSRDNSVNQQLSYSGNSSGVQTPRWPYLRLVDDSGRPITVDNVTLRALYRDTVGKGNLLDWTYNPIKEIAHNSNTSNPKDLSINLTVQYKLPFGFSAQGMYGYQHIQNTLSNWDGMGSYAMRHLINYYSQWNDESVLKRPIPLGDRLNNLYDQTSSQTGRVQLNYSSAFSDVHHRLEGLLASEIRDKNFSRTSSLYYGYDPDKLTHVAVDLAGLYPVNNRKTGGAKIPDATLFENQTNRYVSIFGNLNYTYSDKYLLSASFRKDASNLFGVSANQKWEPLWSVGAGWHILKEDFIKSSPDDILKFRASFGYAGRANPTYSAVPIIYYRGSAPLTNLAYANITSLGNPSLSWEKIRTINVGLDYSFFQRRLSGSVEWYQRNSRELISSNPVDPTSGFLTMVTNGGELQAKGFELEVNSLNFYSAAFRWNSKLLFNRNRTFVKSYNYKWPSATNYVMPSAGANAVLREGYDVGTVFAFPFAGLDNQNGDPLGYLDGEVSKDYNAILYGPFEQLRSVGPGIPVYYASLGNEFSYKGVSINVNLQARLKFRYIRPTFNERNAAEFRQGHPDYNLRWQKPGDELHTIVPSLQYPIDTYRSEFMMGADALVEKGDNIRIQDMQLAYDLGDFKSLKNIRVYGFAKNLNWILWKASSYPLDPEYRDAIPAPLSISFGLNFTL
ncbi:SusC/RagA family TonB-linked outer membrane protein [Sphingobacterium yanglingense]|uniref:TonB-linked SusC/RagA family outer membrane protein n=1 Tax=Sphingobacterium yanglingense TaxID=1437280 RepID=A0A4R6W912_9SPHI|nr:SusC/RagA family TonB-linked outer membrane protein [Sphingobacterium yanglingense]TDQ73659.1 TonB-linked SusC/RagA family outer membrane protein [Sphingobacterium yanglingense]